MPLDFAVEHLDFGRAFGDGDAEFSAEIDHFARRGAQAETDGGLGNAGAHFALVHGHFHGGKQFELGLAFDHDVDAAEQLQLRRSGGEVDAAGGNQRALCERAIPDGIDLTGDDAEAAGGGFGGGLGRTGGLPKQRADGEQGGEGGGEGEGAGGGEGGASQ